jgi:hypothetical protein
MTFWLILIALLVLGGAVSWWGAGRSPMRSSRWDDTAKLQGANLRKHGSAGGGGGTGIPGGGGSF